MPLLPDLRFSPYVKPYVGSAAREQEGVLRNRITDYDIAKSNDDILGLQTDTLLQGVAPFEGDRKFALQLQDMYRKRIGDRVQNGNYEDLVTETNRDAKEFLRRITPLQENYKRYSDYITQIDKDAAEGHIDRETAEATKRYAVSTYQGLDHNNVASTLFRGIQPGRKFNVTEFIDKVGNDWESHKGAVEIETPDGKIIKKKWDQLSPQELAKGFERALRGNRDFQSYAETQGMIGLGQKLGAELTNALEYGIGKYAKNNSEQGLGYVPKYVFDNMQLDFNYGPDVVGASGSPSVNPMAIDESDGKSLFSYVDEKGNPVNAFSRFAAKVDAGIERFLGPPATEAGKKRYEQRLAELDKKAGEATVSDEIKPLLNRLTQQTLKYNDRLPVSQRKPSSYYATKEGQEAILRDYQAAIENNQNFINNRKLTREGIPNNLRKGGVDNVVAQNLFGRKVAVKATNESDVAGLPEGIEKGLNFDALVSKLEDEGYKVDITKAQGNGIDYINFFGNRPSASVVLKLEKDGHITPLEISAEMNEQEGRLFQPMQMVMSSIATGVPGKVKLPGGETFDVDVYVNPNTKSFEGTVRHLSPEGKVIGENIGIKDFPIYYTKLLRDSISPRKFNEIFGYKSTKEYNDEE